jgi:hypothetical protein
MHSLSRWARSWQTSSVGGDIIVWLSAMLLLLLLPPLPPLLLPLLPPLLLPLLLPPLLLLLPPPPPLPSLRCCRRSALPSTAKHHPRSVRVAAYLRGGRTAEQEALALEYELYNYAQQLLTCRAEIVSERRPNRVRNRIKDG